MIPIPPQLLAIGAGAAILAGFAGGWQVRAWKCEAAIAMHIKQDIKEAAVAQHTVDTAATGYEQERADAKPRTQAREQAMRIIFRDRTVPSDCAVPDAARSVLDDAVREANARASGEPGAAVPDASSTTGTAARP